MNSLTSQFWKQTLPPELKARSRNQFNNTIDIADYNQRQNNDEDYEDDEYEPPYQSDDEQNIQMANKGMDEFEETEEYKTINSNVNLSYDSITQKPLLMSKQKKK